jgi:hypothetical protein
MCLLLYDCDRENKIARTNIVDNILTLDNLTKASVDAVKMLSILTIVADEELRASRILTAMSH